MQDTLNTVMEIQNLGLMVPELWLAIGAMVLLMLGVFSGERSSSRVFGLAIALIVAALAAQLLLVEDGEAMNGAFIVDPFARFMKLLVLAGSGIALVMSVTFLKREQLQRFEYPVIVLLATLGMLLMISANDLIALYLGLELQSLSLYVLASINRDSVRASEAGLKYFVLGALSSGMLLYGASLIYGFTGHTGFAGIAEAMAASDRSIGLIFGLVFLLSGIAFKISAVPFHMWTPDVYEGAPTPVAAFFAAAPKIAAMAMLVRIVIGAFEPVDPADFASYNDFGFVPEAEIGNGNYVLHDSKNGGNQFDLYNLTQGETYYFSFYEYAISESGELYLTPGYAASQPTSTPPTLLPTNLTVEPPCGNNIQVSWDINLQDPNTGDGRLVILSEEPLNAVPMSTVNYTADFDYGEGSPIGNGFVVYKGSGVLFPPNLLEETQITISICLNTMEWIQIPHLTRPPCRD